MKRVRVPNKNILKWLLKNFGVGGFENYDNEQMINILKGIYLLILECGCIELDFVSKMLYKLSEKPELMEEFLNDLEEFGISK